MAALAAGDGNGQSRPFKRAAGWTVVGVGTGLTCFWTYWGILENFHEGWYYRSIWSNVALAIAQYLLPMLMFLVPTAAAVVRPRVAAALFVAVAAAAAWRFSGSTPVVLVGSIVVPLLALASLSAWATMPAPRVALPIALGLPVLLALGVGVEPAWRVLHRVDDGVTDARSIAGNGVSLTWAAAGPGWPTEGTSWYAAMQTVRYLTADGLTLAAEPQGVWRLPTIDEAVGSLVRGGTNAGGHWNGTTSVGTFDRTPDKESPLWDPHSKIIYWWTATSVDSARAWRLAYNGRVLPVRKDVRWGYLAFRAVKGAP